MNDLLFLVALIAIGVGLFGIFYPEDARELFWPRSEPEDVDEGSAYGGTPLAAVTEPLWAPSVPEPTFAWREKAYMGGKVISPLFHHPRAAGRWCAEQGLYAAHLTFCVIRDGVEYRAEPEDAAVALLEAEARMREAAC